jgi:murein L,D-transpeptidase YcbB/YkuD
MTKQGKLFFLAIGLVFLVCAEPRSAAPAARQALQHSLNEILINHPTTTLGFRDLQADPSAVDRVLLSMYLKNGITPYWVTANGPGPKANDLVKVLLDSYQDGLNPDHYRLNAIKNLWQSRKPADLARLDVMLTMAMGAYVADMREGRAVTCKLDPRLFASARDQDVDIIKVIGDALKAPDLMQYLQMQAPQHFGYQSLKKILAHYRQLEKNGGWPAIQDGVVLKPGMTDERIPVLARRLLISGDLTGPMPTSNLYDDRMVAAVKHFQQRYNLDRDGVIGKSTLAALNIPVEDHIRRIIINMERWRWLPHDLDGRRLLVNIAGFILAGTRDEKLEIVMPVIVGKEQHETPVFTHTMEYIEFNPYWNIPNSIAENEIVPKMIRDPHHLAKKHIRIFDSWAENAREISPASIDWHTIGSGIRKYRLRQDPGPENALGTVKFMFPNKYNVYLHDTPGHSLFKRTTRTFSHGCIRVSDPRGLALYILNNDEHGWSAQRISAIIKEGKRQVVPLKHPFPVHILYRTVLVDPRDGTVYFYDDIYGRDTLLARALFNDIQPTQCRYTDD